MADNVGDTIHLGGGGPSSVKQRRPRLRLNCSECRGKKLSCDRKLPCQRCVRAGKPDLCTYEAFPPGTRTSPGLRGPPTGFNEVDFGGAQSKQNDDQIRELQAEIAQLKDHLFQTTLSQSTAEVYGDIEDLSTEVPVASDSGSDGQATVTSPVTTPNNSLSFIQKPTRLYHSSSTLLRMFYDIPQLPPYLKTLSDEHLKPRGIHLSRTHYPDDALNSNVDVTHLLALFPPKDDTDALVLFYLNHTEHVHRIVHVPTFEREYVNFWLQEPQLRHPAIAALILSMISVAIATSNLFPESSHYRPMVPHWICASSQWLNSQWPSRSPKPRTLVYYQLSCLIHVAKRLNWIRQRPFWADTAPLIQNAILDGLHLEPPESVSPYKREIRRRIWATLRELDLQTSFEYGLPTILHTLESTTLSPSNLNDSDFDEASKRLPPSRPRSEYTQTSYQFLSAQDFDLRLEISRGLANDITPSSYSQVLQYTQKLTEKLDSLPGWTIEAGTPNDGPRKVALMVWAFLQYQLKECLILLHRPFVHPIPPATSFPTESFPSSSLSETILYQNALSILLLTRKLAVLGSQCLTLMRNDLTLACLALCLVTLSRPKGSLSIPIINADQTVALFEDMLPFFEAWFLRSCNSYNYTHTPPPLLFATPGFGDQGALDVVAASGLTDQSTPTGTSPGTPQQGGTSSSSTWRASTNTPAAWRVLMIYAVLIVTKLHVGKDNEARAYPCCANRFSGFWNSHIDRRVEQQQREQHMFQQQQAQQQGGMMSMVDGSVASGYEPGSSNMWQHDHGNSYGQSANMDNKNSTWNFEIAGGRTSDPFSLEIEQAGW
ncbi:hypothetical protein V8F20_007398 [Naviculisporaceae sp. PSN 640]